MQCAWRAAWAADALPNAIVSSIVLLRHHCGRLRSRELAAHCVHLYHVDEGRGSGGGAAKTPDRGEHVRRRTMSGIIREAEAFQKECPRNRLRLMRRIRAALDQRFDDRAVHEQIDLLR